ncbi:vacuolar amino acid permease [Pseudohyphozyma bogoriensis]|nr:vacuolar amino acid permease [Pseudohyphozyma bogoriensis]
MSSTTETERTPLVPPPKDVTPDSSDPASLTGRARSLVLCAVFMTVFLGALDSTIVSVLVSDISSSFAKANQASWLGTSYLLSTATFTPLYGRLAAILGRRWAALLAISLFSIGTAICGFAPSMSWLIAGRLVAGMGGGGIMALSSVIGSDLVPLKHRALLQGFSNLFYGAGSGLGGPVGGLISDNFGWRWAFIIQLPLLVTAIALVFCFVRYTVPGQGQSRKEMLSRVDYGGSLSLIISLGSLLVGLSYKNNNNLEWNNPLVWGPLIVFGVFTVVFVLVEAFWAKEPVMPIPLLKQRNPMLHCITNISMASTAFSVLYFYPMYFEVVKLQSASVSGSHLLPNSVALSMGSLFAGYMIRHTGSYKLLTSFGTALPVASCVMMACLTARTGLFLQWFSVIPGGFGYSSALTSGLIALMASVPRSEMATATGLSYLFRYVGQVVGVGISSAVLQSVLTAQLHARITGPGAEKTINKIRHVATSIATLSPEDKEAAITSYELGLRSVFVLNAGISLLAFGATLWLKQYPLHGSFEEEDAERRRREEAADRDED